MWNALIFSSQSSVVMVNWSAENGCAAVAGREKSPFFLKDWPVTNAHTMFLEMLHLLSECVALFR